MILGLLYMYQGWHYRPATNMHFPSLENWISWIGWKCICEFEGRVTGELRFAANGQAAQAEKCQAAQAAAKPSAAVKTFQSSLLKVGGKGYDKLISRVNVVFKYAF